jgi:hypothetical protein
LRDWHANLNNPESKCRHKLPRLRLAWCLLPAFSLGRTSRGSCTTFAGTSADANRGNHRVSRGRGLIYIPHAMECIGQSVLGGAVIPSRRSAVDHDASLGANSCCLLLQRRSGCHKTKHSRHFRTPHRVRHVTRSRVMPPRLEESAQLSRPGCEKTQELRASTAGRS